MPLFRGGGGGHDLYVFVLTDAWLFSTFLTLDQSLVTVDGGIGWADVVTVPELLAGTITSLSAVCPFAPVCGDTACGKKKSAEVQNRIRNRQEVSYF